MTLSREEFAALAGVGEREGVFDESEMRILRNLFHFGSLRTRDIMTPRTVMFSLEENVSVREALSERGSMIFSRIPIWKESPDHVTGYILKDQLLLRAARDELDAPIRSFAREPLVVPDAIPVPTLFEKLLDNREHIAIVVDEFGSAIGIIAGYYGGRTDNLLMRAIDMLMAFPYILLALAIVAALGPGLVNALIAADKAHLDETAGDRAGRVARDGGISVWCGDGPTLHVTVGRVNPIDRSRAMTLRLPDGA